MSEVADRRRSLLQALIHRFSAMPEIRGMFLSGSIASGSEDAASDIDLRVLVADEAWNAVLPQRGLLVERFDSFLFHQSIESDHTVSYFSGGFKLDCFYYRTSQFSPSPWLSLPTVIIFDHDRTLARAIRLSNGLSFKAEETQVEWAARNAAAHAIESAKRLWRGDIAYAESLYQSAAEKVALVDDLLCGRPPVGLNRFWERGSSKVVAAVCAPLVVAPRERCLAMCSCLLDLLEEARRRGVMQERVVAAIKNATLECILLLELPRAT